MKPRRATATAASAGRAPGAFPATLLAIFALGLAPGTPGWPADRCVADAPPVPAPAWIPERGPEPVALAGAEVAWGQTFGTAHTDWVNDLVPLAGGDFLGVSFVGRGEGEGAEWDGLAHRFGPDGRPRWTRRLGGPGLDALWAGVETHDGRLALAGFSSRGGGGGTDAWLVLLDGEDGRPLAEHWYGGPGGERATDLVPAGDGLLLVGQTQSPGADEDVYIVRTDGAGAELWSRTWGGPAPDRGFFGVATPGGDFVISGVTGERNAYDLLMLGLDPAGEVTWHRSFGGEANDPSHGIVSLPDGRVVVVGYTASWGAAEHDLVAVTLSRDGEILSAETMGGPGDDRVMSARPAMDGGVWLVGYTTSLGGGGWDVMLARLDEDGRFAPWLAALGTPADDHGAALLETADGGLLLGGYSNAAGGEGATPDLLLARLRRGLPSQRLDGLAVRAVAPEQAAPATDP